MKKLFLFVAAAAMFAACSETEVLDQAAQQQVSEQGGIKFDVYTQRNVTRGGGYTGDITNKTIAGKDKGFGVFAYYTASEQYSTSAKPNFMYNQKIWTETEATYGTLWKYEPVKYWPNEYGSAAISDDTDYVTFFAYAPWTEFEPTTGEVVPTEAPEGWDEEKDGSWVERQQNYDIISVNKNNATGDPIIKYVVDTDPATSVDLLWGVAAEQAPVDYTPIDGVGGSTAANNGVTVTPGLPFLNLVKPNDPVNDKLVFNLKHALAKVRISIDYVADQVTPLEGTFADGTNWFQEYDADGNIVSTTTAPSPLSEIINADETRIYVRSFAIEGWATEGALNLNNSEAGIPLWKDIDGVKDITFSKITYFDGLKDGKEGTDNNIQKSETPIGLNPAIIENYAQLDTIFEVIPAVEAQPAVLYADAAEYNAAKGTELTEEEFAALDDEAKIKTPAVEAQDEQKIAKGFKFGAKKNPGVAAMTADLVAEATEKAATVQTPEAGNGYEGSVLLFGGDPEENDGYFYVIPRNGEEDVNVYITYDVQTIDPALADKLADNLTKGSIIENNIYKEAIFGDGIDFEPGKQYDIKIHLGMTSVKIEATVTPWVENGETTVNLPNNQDPNEAEEEAVVYQYTFNSFGDAAGTIVWATAGKAEATENVKGSFQEIKVISNGDGPTEFNNRTFYINAAAQAADGETIYELYTYNAETETMVSAGIWVKITAKAEKE
jgi:YD repeat-containing protein